jgi:hypothetical protein
MPLAARDAFHVSECESDAFPLQPFMLTCATAGALAANGTALRMFLQQSNATAFEALAQASGAYLPCTRTGAAVLLAIFAIQVCGGASQETPSPPSGHPPYHPAPRAPRSA